MNDKKTYYWQVRGEDVYVNNGMIRTTDFESAYKEIQQVRDALQKHTLEKLRITTIDEEELLPLDYFK